MAIKCLLSHGKNAICREKTHYNSGSRDVKKNDAYEEGEKPWRQHSASMMPNQSLRKKVSADELAPGLFTLSLEYSFRHKPEL